MAKIKVIFYIPPIDNDGRDLDAEIDVLEDALYTEFRTWTDNGSARGTYEMPDGSRSEDVTLVYSLILDESSLPELKRILTAFKAKTLQDALYLEIQRNIEIDYI